MARLSLEGVSRKRVLRSVSLTVEAGEIVSVFAPRAIRSVLLRVAAGIEAPDAGSVRTVGRLVFAQGLWPDAGGSGVLRQLMLPLIAQEGSVAQARSRALEVLSEWRVAEWSGLEIDDLEEHQQARLALIRALVARPDILLVDDPTAGLDGSHAEMVLEILRAARARGVATLFAASSAETMRDADGVYTITQGVLRGLGGDPAIVVPLVRSEAR